MPRNCGTVALYGPLFNFIFFGGPSVAFYGPFIFFGGPPKKLNK